MLDRALSLVVLAAVSVAAPAAAQISSAIPAAPVDPDTIGWPGYGRDPSHNAIHPTPSQSLQRIRWSTPVDLQPQYTGPYLLIHYGSPLVTPGGTVLVTVKTGATGGFQVEAHRPSDGALLWTMPTDYQLAPHNWTPSCGPTLTPFDGLAVPASGGTILMRNWPDSNVGLTRRVAFYGLANYQANPAAYDANVVIDTPITSDAQGNLYFGFVVLGATPIGLSGGLARISANGVGSWVSAATAANDPNMRKVTYNCAPAMSQDGSAVYVSVNDVATSGFGAGYLLKLDATTLATISKVRLKDVVNPGSDAYLADDGTASPTVGPDGDVYYGVLERPFGSNHLRGWMLHFDGSLTVNKPAGAFGWDDTASIVPASAVPPYTGTSSYLILTKYNNYGSGGGDGINKLAVLDPNATSTDPITGATVMLPILTIAGPTPDSQFPGGVREWCINTAAVDPARHSALVNNEDGKMYRWDFATNTLTETVTLTIGIGEAYTPTIIGNDGTVYAINDARLYAIGI